MAIPPEFETPRLSLRRLHPDDAPFIVALLNEPSFLEHIGDRGVRDLDDAERYLRDGPMSMYQRFGFGLWQVSRRSDGVAIGMCGLLKRDALPEVDLGYALFPAFWGRGYALEAAAATLRRGADEYGLRRVLAVVSQGNSASIHVLQKLGMRFECLHAMDPGEPEVRLYAREL